MKVFWNPKGVPSGVNTFSPSWKKPKLFMDAIATMSPVVYLSEPVSPGELRVVHAPEYVKGVLGGWTANGFGTFQKEVADSCLYTVGMFADAASYTAQTGESTCAPVSGFHHAGYRYGGGFCTFNGLMVAATRLLLKGLRPIIVDLDAHYGDGTESILSELGLREHVPHLTFGGLTGYQKKNLPEVLPNLLKHLPEGDIVLYQAGADPHIDDPLGRYLTTEQMRQRDEQVFQWAHDKAMPVVWNLAGGYQPPVKKVIDLHLTTYRLAMEWLD